MTILTANTNFNQKTSKDVVKLIGQDDICASITAKSSILNPIAASLAWSHERNPINSSIPKDFLAEFETISERKEIIRSNASNVDYNSIALSHSIYLTEEFKQEQNAYLVRFAGYILHSKVIDLHSWIRALIILPLSAISFLIVISILGITIPESIFATKVYMSLFCAGSIGIYAVNLIFSEARKLNHSLPQKVLLYTAGFLLAYEVWMLFSIYFDKLR